MTPLPARLAYLALVAVALTGPAAAQTSTTSQPADESDTEAPVEIDACGVLTQAGSCVVFEGGGGRYVLADYGRYRAGDAVRVVGTADPTCLQICPDADGCIRGATLYDPAVWPCGTPIPSLGEDLIPELTSSLCSAASGAVGTGALIGLWLSRGRRSLRRAP